MEGTGEARPKEEWRSVVRSTLLDFENSYLYPESENPTMGYFARAGRMAIEHQYFFDLVYEMHHLQPRVRPREAVNILLRGYQADQLEQRRQGKTSYPEGFDDEEMWLSAFEDVENDILRWGVLRNNVCENRIQSNVAERYKTVQLLANLLKERLGENPSVLDVGCSVLHGGMKLAYSNQPNPPCKPFESMNLLYDYNGEFYSPDKRLSHIANVVLSQHVSFGEIVGVDITDVNDTAIKQWAKSCSFYPDELRNPVKEAEYDALDELDPLHERVQFSEVDFTSSSEVRAFQKSSSIQKFGFVILSAMLYQQESKADQRRILKHAKQLVSDDGIILIQDARKGNFNEKFSFKASVLDAHHLDAGEQKIISWETGRCKRGVVEDGVISSGGVRKNLTELLMSHAD